MLKKLIYNGEIAGFWQRIGSLFIDSILLGVVGLILGAIFTGYFVQIGIHGVFIGFFITFFYFSFFNSKLCKGQTFGKRFFNIKVVNPIGKKIPLLKSFLRSLILILPFFFLGYPIYYEPYLPSFLITFLQSILIFILVGIVWFYIVNKFTRQSLHDLALSTFVVKVEEVKEIENPLSIKSYVFLGYIGVILALIGYSLLTYVKINNKEELLQIRSELQTIDGVVDAFVSDNTAFQYFGSGDKSGETLPLRSLDITVRVTFNPTELKYLEELENSEVVKKASKVILKNYSEVENLNYISIQLFYGYNIGIAKYNQSYTLSKSPTEWKEMLK